MTCYFYKQYLHFEYLLMQQVGLFNKLAFRDCSEIDVNHKLAKFDILSHLSTYVEQFIYFSLFKVTLCQFLTDPLLCWRQLWMAPYSQGCCYRVCHPSWCLFTTLVSLKLWTSSSAAGYALLLVISTKAALRWGIPPFFQFL